MDGFTWTRHVEHGGCFRCPDDALDEMTTAGWLPCEPPEPHNPAVAEQLAWRAEQQAAATQPQTLDNPAASRGSSKEE